MRPLRALPDPGDLLATVRAQPRAFTRAELLTHASARRLRTELDHGTIVRLLPDSYVAGEHQHSFAARADAALAWAGPDSMLAGRSALHAYGLIAPPDHLDVAVPPGMHRRPPAWLTATQVTYPLSPVRIGALTAAPVAFAIAQAYGVLSDRQRADAVFGAVGRRLCTARDLRAVLNVMPRIKARRALTSRIAAAETGAHSWLEELTLTDVLTGKSFRELLRQHEVVVEGHQFFLDMYCPRTRTAIEADGATWHRGDEQRQRDIRRDALLATIGIQTLRLSGRDLIERPDWCRAMVAGVLRARAQDVRT
ncbi:endonuclease domain-containing protein [Demequina sp.]|uniref:endonuclease domain-containing protein n=1 Tax=Demequina sp. TaxID=2050685 RepID=UPI003A85CA22